ncbi:Fic family protein [Roseibium sp. RKSG952]|uniref:Fic/DOC family protein n=1 Tax=Roseibium sp. RKSG952 TaxID=2529384 RepID=UPI001AD8D020|nr:Fic family protein [Roseibium sp. RKSG952]
MISRRLIMAWDPFGDFSSRGILRNKFGTKDQTTLERLEKFSIEANMPRALNILSREQRIDLRAWRRTHAVLFSDIYPWAGKIRALDVERANVRFNTVRMIEEEAAVVFAKAEDGDFFRENMDYVYGELAFNHPFMDGNGRSLNTVFSEMSRRAGISIRWDVVDKGEYLRHLTRAVQLTEYEGLGEYLSSLAIPVEDNDMSARRLIQTLPPSKM